MRIAVTGATGFLGRYIVQHLTDSEHLCRCWVRETSDTSGFSSEADGIQWCRGHLGEQSSCDELVRGCDAVVHSALYRPGDTFRGGEGDLTEFVQTNVVGTIQLIEAARRAGVGRFVFISTCAVHEKILDDRPLDETHPLWPLSHYGAHKAAIEKFVHSYGLGHGYPICALRPTGIYGLTRQSGQSKWFDLIRSVVNGKSVECTRGGKEVHALDVARAVGLLLEADASAITGEAFNCCDRYISELDVATLAKELTGSSAEIRGSQTRPKNEIDTQRIRGLGMQFGGEPLLRSTIQQLIEADDAH